MASNTLSTISGATADNSTLNAGSQPAQHSLAHTASPNSQSLRQQVAARSGPASVYPDTAIAMSEQPVGSTVIADSGESAVSPDHREETVSPSEQSLGRGELCDCLSLETWQTGLGDIPDFIINTDVPPETIAISLEEARIMFDSDGALPDLDLRIYSDKPTYKVFSEGGAVEKRGWRAFVDVRPYPVSERAIWIVGETVGEFRPALTSLSIIISDLYARYMDEGWEPRSYRTEPLSIADTNIEGCSACGKKLR